jgi:hypothetical protein
MSWVRRALAMASAFCLLPVAARAGDPYADFRVPDHRTFSWAVTALINASGAYYGAPGGESRNSAYRSTLANSQKWHAESETRQYDLGVGQQLDWSRGSLREDQSFTQLYRQVEHNRTDRQELTLTANRSDYPGGGPFFLSYSASTSLLFSQRVFADNTHAITPPDEFLSGQNNELREYLQDGVATVGAGAGRIRNVTGVYSAQLLEARLRATGRLTRPLSDESRRRLAAAYYIAPELNVAHERSDKYFWREVERILREDGALEGSSLDAYSLQRLLEPATNRVFWTRLSGIRVTPFLSVVETRGHSDFDLHTSSLFRSGGVPVAGSEFASSDRTHSKRDEATVGLELRCEKPAGPRWQWEFNSSGGYGGGRRRASSLNSSAQVTWLVADRWYALGAVAHSIQSARIDGARYLPNWQYGSNATVGYWVEDSWSLDLSLANNQFATRFRSPFFNFVSYQRNASLNLGLSYRPAGRFAAPGLGISERLTTPPL